LGELNESRFKNVVGREPGIGTGRRRRSSGGPADACSTSAQAGLSGSDGRGKGNSGDEERDRHVWQLAGREKEIGEGMANVYANEFSEQELKDLVTFYKSPLGQKLLATEPRAVQFSIAYMNQWAQAFAETVNGEFRAEMRKRGKEI
jgi:hypothetical protein